MVIINHRFFRRFAPAFGALSISFSRNEFATGEYDPISAFLNDERVCLHITQGVLASRIATLGLASEAH